MGGASPDGLPGGDQVSFHGRGRFRVGQDAIILRLCRARALSFECHVEHAAQTVTEIRQSSSANPSRQGVARPVLQAVRDQWTGF